MSDIEETRCLSPAIDFVASKAITDGMRHRDDPLYSQARGITPTVLCHDQGGRGALVKIPQNSLQRAWEGRKAFCYPASMEVNYDAAARKVDKRQQTQISDNWDQLRASTRENE
jgi:hypothetical protein